MASGNRNVIDEDLDLLDDDDEIDDELPGGSTTNQSTTSTSQSTSQTSASAGESKGGKKHYFTRVRCANFFLNFELGCITFDIKKRENRTSIA